MSQTTEEQLKLIMTCLKHTADRGKPDFEEVGKELGISAKQCYHRHWALLKKWGLTGSRAPDAGSALASGTTAPATPAPVTPTSNGKRGRPKSSNTKKSGKVTEDANVADADGYDDDDALDKKETPLKKVKVKQAEEETNDVREVIEINDAGPKEEIED